MSELQIPEGFTHDCHECQGLCCVAMEIEPHRGYFPHHKEAYEPCENLQITPDADRTDFKCRIFKTINKGHKTCEQFTCFGAGDSVSKFFSELGINWAMKPDEPNTEQHEVNIANLYATYNILFLVMAYLGRVRYHRNPANKLNYEATKIAAQEVATELSQKLQAGELIDENIWYGQKFLPAMAEAVKRSNADFMLKKLGNINWSNLFDK